MATLKSKLMWVLNPMVKQILFVYVLACGALLFYLYIYVDKIEIQDTQS